ncbi:hypothetical protein FQ192_10525 [Pseudomonas sp. ANT_J12]|uniref:hypothetical protein n=1 Tax=Pseudomonas sp. ANT_J12 TaxID=2597351 RepID=UPI0011F0BF23|nr:hypothetical protein [Pseudomonas sp. ANT_J12]KAA0995467.1 hypothetical protein FQ192_10525 [Pseudomonas sp. ANT_J12]
MSDHGELKRLAEAFPDYDYDSNTEPFFNGPSGESLGGGSTGFYCVYGPDFEIDGDHYDGNTLVEVTTRDQAKFICEAKAGILALITENEKLKGDLREVKDAKLGLSWAIGEIMGERDQLRTENAGLKTGYEAYEAQNAALLKDLESHKRMLLNAAISFGAVGAALGGEMDDDASELEGLAQELRKDAERYRWLRARDLETIRHGGVFAGQTPSNVVLNGDDLDANIDAVMGQGEQS